MEFQLKDVLYIVGIVASALISFLATRHGLKDYIRDRHDHLKDQISELKMQLLELKAKDDLQQQVIDQVGQQMKELVPRLVEKLESKKQGNE